MAGTARSGRSAARGLNRVPQYKKPEDEKIANMSREERRERRKIQHKLFSRGFGMDIPLFSFIMVLLAIGLVMLYSASFAYSYYNEGGDMFYYIKRQGLFALVGVIAMMGVSFFDYHRFHGLVFPIYIAAVVLLMAVLLFGRVLHIRGIAPNEGDAYRWIRLGPIQFQPSEIAKFAVIALCAHYISQHAEEMRTLRYGVLPFLGIVGVPVLLVYLENHLSGTIIILLLGGILMILGGTRFKHIFFLLLLGGGLLALFLLVRSSGGGDEDGGTAAGQSYQMLRIIGWLNPFDPPEGVDTWQTRQSLYAIGSGGLLGVGLGQSRQKYLYLPEPQNDFIFAIVCEELGLVGALIIILLFAMLIWRGMYVSLHAKDRFGMLLGLGITFQIGLQTVLNLCVVTNTIPNTGISLPFFSYGGTSLLMLLGEMGILLNISRSSNIEVT